MCDGEAGGGGHEPGGEKQGRHQRLQRLLRYLFLFFPIFRCMAGGQVNFDRSAGSLFSSGRSFLRFLHLAVGFRQQRGFMQAALQTEKFIILKFFFITLFKTGSSAALQILLCRKMLVLNPGQVRLRHWLSDALIIPLDLIHTRLDLIIFFLFLQKCVNSTTLEQTKLICNPRSFLF